MDGPETLESSLKKAFAKVKEDIKRNSDEISELKNLVRELNSTLSALNLKLQELAKREKDVQRPSLRVRPLEVPLEMMGSQRIVSVRQPETGSKLEAEFLKKFKKNKREIIKSKILSLIQNKKLSTNELKEIIVNQLAYCSKASFYRYLEELQHEKKVGRAITYGKEILVLA